MPSKHVTAFAFRWGRALTGLLLAGLVDPVGVAGEKEMTGEFFVATDGDDANPGTGDKPFATPERARDAVRELKKQGLPRGGVTVRLRAGTYERRRTFELAAEDSGTAEAPVVYRAGAGARAILCGGVRVPELAPVRDEAILARLPENARGKVLCADLKALGIARFGEVQPRGFQLQTPPVTEVFFDGRPLPIARWPNAGFVKTGKVLAGRPTARGKGDYGPATFEFRHERLARWIKARDAQVLGYWRYLWADAALGVAEVDAQAGRVRLAHASPYGTESNMPFYFFNLLEEIDQPGEWYLDRERGVLYLWPPSDPAKAVVEMSLFDGPFVRMAGASHVRIEGLTFELARGSAVAIAGGEDCRLAGCTIRRLGGDAVLIDDGKRHVVRSCDLEELGRGGVRITGGDRRTLERCDHAVENCHIHDFSRVDRTYTPAVHVFGVGVRIAHNLVHDSPAHGLRVDGNDHLVEFNDVWAVAMETDDQGGLDTWGDPTFRGNVIRHNYWHDIGPGDAPCGRAGIRLDDAISGTLIQGNVFARCSRGKFGGVQIHGGKDNVVENNVFYDCRAAVSFSRWGKAVWEERLKTMFAAKLKAVTFDRAPYSERYPELLRLHDDVDVNRVRNNVILSCGQAFLKDGGIQRLEGNLVVKENPGFAAPERGDFRLKPGAAVLEKVPGFKPIPFEKIGLEPDEYRRELPGRKNGEQ